MRPVTPTPAVIDPTWVGTPSGIEPKHLDEIVRYGDVLLRVDGKDGMVGGPLPISKVVPTMRRSRITWFTWAGPADWVFGLLEPLVLLANARHWNFDLTGFYDMLQYTTYGVDGHYTWHQDKFPSPERPQRKLGFSLLLSDPTDYDGGDLEINDGRPSTIPHRNRGDLIVFPSYVVHRVAPVTRGVRRSLVGWVSGPRFR